MLPQILGLERRGDETRSGEWHKLAVRYAQIECQIRGARVLDADLLVALRVERVEHVLDDLWWRSEAPSTHMSRRFIESVVQCRLSERNSVVLKCARLRAHSHKFFEFKIFYFCFNQLVFGISKLNKNYSFCFFVILTSTGEDRKESDCEHHQTRQAAFAKRSNSSSTKCTSNNQRDERADSNRPNRVLRDEF